MQSVTPLSALSRWESTHVLTESLRSRNVHKPPGPQFGTASNASKRTARHSVVSAQVGNNHPYRHSGSSSAQSAWQGRPRPASATGSEFGGSPGQYGRRSSDSPPEGARHDAAKMPARPASPADKAVGGQLKVTQRQEAGDLQAGPGAATVRMCTVKFALKFHVGFGQSIRIIGHGPQLGNWILQDAPNLEWGPDDVWTVVVDLPQSSVIEYKYVVIDSYGNAASWQIGNNNILAVKHNQDELFVNDNWEGTPEASVEAKGVITSRQNQLMSWASEVQAMMTSTKNELRQSRLELMNAKEEARVAKVEVKQLRAELAEARLVADKQRVEIKGLREEVYRAKLQLESSRKEHIKAFESASALLEDMDMEDGSSLPPLPTSSARRAYPSGHQISKPSPAANTASRGWEPPMENRSPQPAPRPSPPPGVTTSMRKGSTEPARPKPFSSPRTSAGGKALSTESQDGQEHTPVTVTPNGSSVSLENESSRLRFSRFENDQV